MTTKTMTKPRYKSEPDAAIHEMVTDFHRAGVVSKTTMREFDDRCLTKVAKLSPAQIRIIRRKAGVSQGVFAQHLNVGKSLVSEWERGKRRPAGPAQKLLTLAHKNGLKAIR